MKSWLILVSHRGLEPIWYGNIEGKTREEAKRNARLFVSSRLTDDAKIVRIAEGKMTITFTGPDTAFDD